MADLHSLNATQVGPTTADVVFIHGLDGDAYDTWAFRSDESWATWLGKDRSDLNVWSLGYDAAASSWSGDTMPLVDRSVNVLATLASFGLGSRPLCFVCHSMGGLVVKQLLREASTASSEYAGIAAAVRGIVFLATPHTGSDVATLALYLRALLRTTASVSELNANAPALRELNRWFRASVAESRIRVKAFYETRPLNGVIVVNASSADPGLVGVTPVPIDSDHVDICKPTSADDLVYRATLQFLSDVIPASEIGAGAPLSRGAPNRIVEIEAPSIIGRAGEIKVLSNAVDEVLVPSARGGRAVLLGGVSGVGKTAIAEHAIHYALSRGYGVARASCELFNEGMSFYSVRELLRQITPPHGLTSDIALAFGAASSQHTIATLAEDGEAEASGRRDAVIATFVNEVFARSALDGTPLMLFIDDLERIDAGSADALLCLLARIHEGRVLVVGAFRSDVVMPSGATTHPLRPVLSVLRRGDRLGELLDVPSLPEEAMAELAATLLHASCDFPPSFVHRLFEETEGNPLYVREALRTMSDERAGNDAAPLRLIDGTWKLVRQGESWEIPRSIDDAIASRLVSLPDEDRSVLERAAVIGKRFQFEVLREVGAVGEDELIQMLENNMSCGLLRELPGSDGVFEFAHGRIRDVLYSSISGLRRAKLHGQVADALGRQSDGLPVDEQDIVLGRHLFAARRYVAAAPCLLRAGNRALALHAWADAVRHFQDALSALEKAQDASRETIDRSRLALGVALKGATEFVPAEAEFLIVLRDGSDPYSQRWALNHLGDVSLLQGRVHEALERFARCETMARDASDNALLAETAADLAELHMRQAEQLAGIDASAAAHHAKLYEHYLDLEQELAPTLDDRPARARAYRNAAKQARVRGDVMRAIDLYEQSLGFVDVGVSSHQYLIPYAKALRLVDRHADALEIVRRVLDWSKQIGARRSEAIARQYMGLILLEQELGETLPDLTAARKEMATAVAMHQDSGFEQGRRETEIDLAELAAYGDGKAGVLGHLRRALVDGTPRQDDETAYAVLAQLRANGESKRADRFLVALRAIGLCTNAATT